jgi:hypothetical protein
LCVHQSKKSALAEKEKTPTDELSPICLAGLGLIHPLAQLF